MKWGIETKDERFVDADDDLLWLHQRAEAEMGVGAIQYGPSTTVVAADILAKALQPGWISAPPPTIRAQRAAQRNRWLRAVFRDLGSEHAVPLSVAYSHRFAGWALADKSEQKLPDRKLNPELGTYVVLYRSFGVAAGAVHRVLLAHGYDPEKALKGTAQSLADEAGRRVRRAQDAFVVERLIHRFRTRRERDQARAAGKARREAYLAELTGEVQQQVMRARAKAFLAANGIEVTT